MRSFIRVLGPFLVVFGATLVFASPPTASPKKDSDGATQTKQKSETREIELGVSAYGFAIGQFMDTPSGGNLVYRPNQPTVDVPYSGFAGVGGGGGIGISAMWRGIIGLELMVFGSNEPAEATLTPTNSAVKAELSVEQTALHVPLVLKIAAPTDSVRPQAFVGFDFVFPGDPTLSTRNLGGIALIKADSYTALRFGFGLEFLLPIEGIDMRIPLNFAGNYNYGLSDNLEPDRLNFQCPVVNEFCGRTYGSQWAWQAQISLGLAYYFL